MTREVKMECMNCGKVFVRDPDCVFYCSKVCEEQDNQKMEKIMDEYTTNTCECCGVNGYWEICQWCDVNCDRVHVLQDPPERWDGDRNYCVCGCNTSFPQFIHYQVGEGGGWGTECELENYNRNPKQLFAKGEHPDDGIPF
jgi:hypothetical protein